LRSISFQSFGFQTVALSSHLQVGIRALWDRQTKGIPGRCCHVLVPRLTASPPVTPPPSPPSPPLSRQSQS
jgi:hypothetical protein